MSTLVVILCIVLFCGIAGFTMICCTFCYTGTIEQTGKSYVIPPPAAPVPKKEHASSGEAHIALPNLLSRAPTDKRRVQPITAWESKVAHDVDGRLKDAAPAPRFSLSALPSSSSPDTISPPTADVLVHSDELELGLDHLEAAQQEMEDSKNCTPDLGQHE